MLFCRIFPFFVELFIITETSKALLVALNLT